MASKATGYPIAKIAAKLAVGYTLDELKNDITGTSAAFEPSIDYAVVKIPRFAFEKFSGADPRLTTQMKSVGEAMALGRSFQEALQKAARSLETARDGVVSLGNKVDYRALAGQVRALRTASMDGPGSPLRLQPPWEGAGEQELDGLKETLLDLIRTPLPERLWYVGDALRSGLSVNDVAQATGIDPWFIDQIQGLVASEREMREHQMSGGGGVTVDAVTAWKRQGFSSGQISELTGLDLSALDSLLARGPAYNAVDTCAAEFKALTPYLYSTWACAGESQRVEGKKVMILGGGPNRIGQGIEFDYCCVHAAFAMKELGITSIMVNCNPETVSTDYDTSDRLYFEPLTLENVLAIARHEQPFGVIVQYGGQTPLKLAVALHEAGVPILGTAADAIDRAEDRERFEQVLEKLGLRRPRGVVAHSKDDAVRLADTVGYPVVVRPSYVLGGRAMHIVHNRTELIRYVHTALDSAETSQQLAILVDEFVEDAVEIDVDAVSDGKSVFIGGIMQHIEEAGVHSGDSSMVLPPALVAGCDD